MSALPEATHILAAALLNYADDDGYFNANPRLIQAECCPLRDPSVSIHDSLTQLSRIGYIEIGTGVDGRRYGRIVKFSEHQRINRKTESKIKELKIDWDDSRTDHTQLTEPSPPEGNREGNREGEKDTRTIGQEPMAPDRPEPSPPAYPPEFEATWQAYPRRAGGNPKTAAFKAWKARRREGVTAAELHAGVVRYAAYVQAAGKAGTEFVKQASTFFGPDEHFREQWQEQEQKSPYADRCVI